MAKTSSLLCCILLISGCSKVDDQNSGKIVSINPCTDAILIELADPQQIGAISHYSHNPKSSSVNVKYTKQFAAVGQSAEEIIALKPSLVLAGAHVSASTLEALRALDIKILQSPVANTVADSHAQISAIANAIGQDERGNALIRDIDTALLNSAPAGDKVVDAIVWQGGGLVPGKGTLIDELLKGSGFNNVANRYNLSQWDIIGLERLSASPPAIILRGGNGADRILQHPILDSIDSQVADFPQSMIWCAGPTIAKAAQRLADIREHHIEAQR